MTLTTPYSASFYVGDGETKSFPFVFEEISDNFIKVIVSHIDGTTSIPTYTVDLDLKQVVFGDETPAPTADDVVCIYRETPTIQDTPFRTLQGYDAKALENILSKIVAMIQEIKSNYFSTQVLQGDPWQLDLLKSADDGATVNIDYVAKKLVKGLYFQITNGNLQVSADGSSYITMPKSADIVEFRQVQTVLEDLTVQYRLQYRIGNEWFNAESNAEATADEAKQIAEEARDIASDAKDIAEDASDKVDGFDDRITQAEQDASDAKDIAQDASDAVSAHITDTNNPHSVTAAQVGALPNTTKYGAALSLTINSTTYVVTAQLKDQDGNNLGTAQTIDLPLESVVVSGAYDSATKEVVLTLKDGSTIRFSVADLVSGLQTEITALNMLSADLVDDTNTTHKFVTTTEKTTWNAKQDAISDLATIRSGASAGATAVQPSDLATVATSGSYNDLSDKPTTPADISAHRVNGAPLSNSASVFYGVSTSAKTVVNKIVSIPSITTLDVGTAILVNPTVTSTVANSGIKLNDFPAYPMRYAGAAITTSTDSIVWAADTPSLWVFDGEYWIFAGHGLDTTYIALSVTEGIKGIGTGFKYVTAANTKKIIQGTTLTDIDVATTGAVTDADSITSGIGKLQATKADKSEIPTVNNPTITITQGGVTKGSFTLNQATGDTIALDAGGGGGGGYHPDLFDYKWADHICNDVQWLRADTFSWQSGAVYQAAYQHLVDDIDIPAYAWYNSDLGVAYSTSENPQVGEGLGLIDSNGFLRFVESIISVSGNTVTTGQGDIWIRQSESDSTAFIQPTLTETIAGTTITYYLADDGHKIVLANQESNVDAIYNATGVAWYYILDTANQRFKLPRTKWGFVGIRNGVGNYVEAGLPNITGAVGYTIGTDATATGAFTKDANTNSAWWSGATNMARASKFHLNASNSSSIYGNSTTVQPPATQMYLYFYVGEFTQTALENTAGITAETLNDKVDIGHDVIEFQAPNAGNNYTWYRKYRDGWVEQGGRIGLNITSVVLPVEMSDADYQCIVTYRNMSGNTNTLKFENAATLTQASTGFTVLTARVSYRNWFVQGMAAS